MRLKNGDANWIATIGVGNCGEFSDLFYAIAMKAGIKSRIVIDSADNHQWNEYFDIARSEWVHVDSSLAPPINIDHPSYYEEIWGKHTSFVYYIDNRSVIDITDRYTNASLLGYLTIHLNGDQTGVSLQIYSWDLVDNCNDIVSNLYNYPVCRDIPPSFDSEGNYRIRLGTNNYTIVVKKGFLYGLRAECKVTLLGGRNKEVSLTMSPAVYPEDIGLGLATLGVGSMIILIWLIRRSQLDRKRGCADPT